MRFAIFALPVLISATLAFPVRAQAPAPTDTTTPRQQIERLQLGTPVTLGLSDATRVTGVLLDRNENGVVIQPAPSDEPQLIAFSRIQSISARTGWRAALSRPGWIFVAAGLVVLAILGVAIAQTPRRKRLNA
jgi:hypothetical protein